MEGGEMSLFPKFKIPTDTPATLATPATFRPESSNPHATQNPDQIADIFFTDEERSGWLYLVVKRPENLSQGPITIGPGLRIMDIAKFTQATIQDLVTYVMAKNKGSSHWVERVLDEKLELLKLCGVKAEIRRLH